MRVTATIIIDESLIEEKFIRASGPGGQHVNKVETAVQLRFNSTACEALTLQTKRRLTQLAGQRATKDGVIVIEASRHRSQDRNRTDARKRLKGLIVSALKPPVKRLKTNVSPGVKRQRLDTKARRGELKQRRAKVRPDTVLD